MSTVSFSPLRQPWVAAILTLVIIWTIWLAHGPTGMLPDGSNVSVSEKAKRPGPSKSSDRPLILYAYSESPVARTNLEFFIQHGLHSAADFIFVMNGETNAWALLPNETNIRYIQRPNDCYDLGAYAEVLQGSSPSNSEVPIYKNYKRYILLNASIRGPFLPYWAETCWSEMYLRKLSDQVKLVGMTGNCWPLFHVQSMIWALDRVGLELLLFPPQPTGTPENPAPEPVVGINDCFHTWDSAVNAEVHASKIVTDAGYKVDVMMSAFHGVDNYAAKCDSERLGDVLWNGHYQGTNVHPFETIFLKTNRDIDPILMERLTTWTDGSNYTSWEMCLY